MAGQPLVAFPDSQIAPPTDAVRIGAAAPDTLIEVSVYVKSRGGDADALAGAMEPRAAIARLPIATISSASAASPRLRG
jgi:hypothetical protein